MASQQNRKQRYKQCIKASYHRLLDELTVAAAIQSNWKSWVHRNRLHMSALSPSKSDQAPCCQCFNLKWFRQILTFCTPHHSSHTNDHTSILRIKSLNMNACIQ